MGVWFEAPIDPAELLTGGVAARRLPAAPHVTLVHLGDRDEAGDADLRFIASRVTELWHRHTGEFTGRVNGSAVFLVGERDFPLPVVLVDSSLLTELRDRLLGALFAANVTISVDYAFQPHVTLADARLGPYNLVKPIPVTFRRVDLVRSKRGKELARWSLPL